MIWLLAFPVVWLIGWVALPHGRYVETLDANGRNWPGFFIVREDAPNREAVWAQEQYEAQTKWRWLPLLWLVDLPGRAFPRIAWFSRRLELMGHEIEVQHIGLHGGDRASARRHEAEVLVRHYPAFKGWTADQCLYALEQRSDRARQWLSRNG